MRWKVTVKEKRREGVGVKAVWMAPSKLEGGVRWVGRQSLGVGDVRDDGGAGG